MELFAVFFCVFFFAVDLFDLFCAFLVEEDELLFAFSLLDFSELALVEEFPETEVVEEDVDDAAGAAEEEDCVVEAGVFVEEDCVAAFDPHATMDIVITPRRPAVIILRKPFLFFPVLFSVFVFICYLHFSMCCLHICGVLFTVDSMHGGP